MPAKEKKRKNYFQLALGLFFCLLVRLIPFRAPNVEPIMATTMPFGKAYGAITASSFAVLSILLYDLITHTFGAQTFFTVLAYGLVGFYSATYFEKHKADKWGYVRFAIIATLFFDAFTGLTVGPLFFHQSFYASFLGQIPFTALHLAGNIAFAYLLSPYIYSLLIKKRQTEQISLIASNFNPKII